MLESLDGLREKWVDAETTSYSHRHSKMSECLQSHEYLKILKHQRVSPDTQRDNKILLSSSRKYQTVYSPVGIRIHVIVCHSSTCPLTALHVVGSPSAVVIHTPLNKILIKSGVQ